MKNAIIFLFFIFTLSSVVSALNWKDSDITDIEKVKVVRITNIADGTNIVLKDSKNNLLEIVYKKGLKKTDALNILNLKNKFFDWDYIKIRNIRFVADNNKLDIFISPEKVMVNKTNIVQYLPSGLFFTYGAAKELQYNFRMNKENFFMRIKGHYISEQELVNKVNDAVKNPAAYIKKRDPEYFLSKLEQLQDKIDLLIKENSMLKWAVITLINDDKIPRKAIEEVVRIKKAHPKYDKYKIRDELDKKNIDLSKSEINIILTVYFNDFDD